MAGIIFISLFHFVFCDWTFTSYIFSPTFSIHLLHGSLQHDSCREHTLILKQVPIESLISWDCWSTVWKISFETSHRKQTSIIVMWFFPSFPFCRGQAGQLSLVCRAMLLCFHCSLLLAFSLHFSSSSAFLRSVFTLSSLLSGCLALFCNLLVSLFQIFSIVSRLSFLPCDQPILSDR